MATSLSQVGGQNGSEGGQQQQGLHSNVVLGSEEKTFLSWFSSFSTKFQFFAWKQISNSTMSSHFLFDAISVSASPAACLESYGKK